MLKINDKTFMNLQEAVQWLLDNNALPFQSSANYVANTEIGMGTIVNPSPAKVRIGSLIFFADSKVSTVTGLTENGFIVSDQYNDLVDDVVYVSNVALNASGHLIVTLSNGTDIDAGLIKQVSSFSINGSQHLIASYNDGTSTDLGAIFSGNISISGNLTVTGGISGNAITGDSIIENMTGYSASDYQGDLTWTPIYIGVVKNGNKLTMVTFGSFTKDSAIRNTANVLLITIPSGIGAKLYPYTVDTYDVLDHKKITASQDNALSNVDEILCALIKSSNTQLMLRLEGMQSLTDGNYFFRAEFTFLLSDNLAS